MKVSFLTSWRTRCGIADYSATLVNALMEYEDIDVVPVEPGRKDTSYFANLGKIMNNGDIAHIQHEYAFFGGAHPLANRFSSFIRQINVPKVMTVHTVRADHAPKRHVDYGNPKSLLDYAFYQVYDKLIASYIEDGLNEGTFGHADRVIVHLHSHRNTLIERGIEENRIRVIPMLVPAVDIDKDGKAAKRELGLDGRKVITLFGFISHDKGHHLLLQIADRLPLDVAILFAGDILSDKDRAYHRTLENLIEEKGLKNIIFAGYVKKEDVPKIFSASDILVYPHLRTNTNTASINLGIAYGKNIVASDIDAAREINAYLPCLRLFRRNDPEDLFEKIIEAIENTDDNERLAENVDRYAVRFSPENTASETYKVYKEVF